MLTIDLDALTRNYSLLCKKAGSGTTAAGIVKADAYGLGMKQVVTALEAQNCPFYFVATLEEALALRALTQKPVAVLNGPGSIAPKDFEHHSLMPVLNCLADIEKWQGNAFIHFDTGMNRLGLTASETEELLENPQYLKGVNVKGIMSHFSSADEESQTETIRQYESFKTIAHHFPDAIKSLANSSGVFRSPDYTFDMVRPGMALYGLNPVPEQDNPMEPVVRLDVPLLQVKSVPKGSPVGYGASYRAPDDTVVGAVALGYADGFLRSLSNKATLYYKDHTCPVIGRVSMDLVTIDLGNTNARQGDTIEVIGKNQSADDLAASAGTIGYEILTSLGNRYPRTYVPVTEKDLSLPAKSV